MRKDRGWTQAELGERAGLHRSAVTLLESGRREPSLSIIVKIAAALGVPVGSLFPPAAAPPGRRRQRSKRKQ